MRATDGNLIAVNATGCLEVFTTPYPETSWQIAVDAFAVRQCGGGRDRRRGGDAGEGTRRGAHHRPGRRRRHHRHRLRLPVRHVRAQRRRALHLLRQRRLHEHRRAALLGDAAGRAHRHDAGAGPPSRATCSAPARACRRSRSPTAFPMSRPRRSPTCTISSARSIKAMGIHGARYIQIHVPCPLGWGSASHDTIRLARLAVESGLFPVFEAEHGVVTAQPQDPQPRAGRRVSEAAEALRASVRDGRGRRAHRQAAGDRRPQHRRVPPARTTRETLMEHPFAITLDVGTSLANHTGSWRTSRPVYVDRLPPCNHACPAGENIQAWLFHAEAGDYETAWRTLTQDNPMPAVMGRVCYHPCEDACNRAKIDTRGRHQFGRALPRRRGDQARLGVRAARRRERQARARRRRRSVGPLGRLSSAPARPHRSRSTRPVRSPAA